MQRCWARDRDEAYYWIYAHQLAWGYFDHPPMIALLIFFGKSLARVFLMLPADLIRMPFNNNLWVEDLKAVTDSSPLVFQYSYRNPAMYQFYTGERAYTFTDNCYRHNQNDLLDGEAALQGQSVWLIGQTTWESSGLQTLSFPGNTFKIKKWMSCRSARR